MAFAVSIASFMRHFYGQFHQPFALHQAHGEKFGLFSRDEQAAQIECVDPVVQVLTVGFFIELQRVIKGSEVGSPNAHHVFAGVFFGF